MKAFLLSAGEGKRLLPLTESKPKSLLKVGGKPLILWNIERLIKEGVDQLIVNLFHEGKQIRDFLGDGSRFGIEINYSYETELLGTGGGVGKALDIIGKEPFLLISSDVWTDFEFSTLSLTSDVIAHLVLIENPKNNFEGDLFLEGNIVKPFGPGKSLTFSGIALIHPSAFQDELKGKYELWKEVLFPASEKGLVTGQVFNGSLINVNSIDDLEKLDAYLTEEYTCPPLGLNKMAKQEYIIAPSILSADFARLGEEVDKVVSAGADWVHFDVMDNHYVPNLTIGPLVCEALRKYGILVPIDVHLMVQPVDSLIENFADCGATYITFHPEASEDVDRSIHLIKKNQCKAGLVLNPASPLSLLDNFWEKLDMILMSVNPGFAGQDFIPSVLNKV